jgi:ATP-dependent Clp protease ATP-binding subunit ClpX
MRTNKQYPDIFDYLDKFVSGQEDAKDTLAILGALYCKRCTAIQSGVSPLYLPRLNLFITGPTGTGKTLLATTLSKCLRIPFIRIDCSSLSQSGWQGVAIEDQLSSFSQALGEDGFGVIMLDEMDKLGCKITSTSGGIPSEGIQYNLLDLLDGRYEHPRVAKAINNCLILCAGAFSGAEEHATTIQRSIGFEENALTINVPAWKDIMVAAGIVPELVGRLLDVIKLNKLTEDDIRNILLNKRNAIRGKYEKLLPGLTFSDEDVDSIVKEAYNSQYGVRQLDTAVFNLVSQKLLQLYGRKK